MSALLQAVSISKQFSGVKALTDVSVDFNQHEITAVIGPNGSGKSTLFNVLAGDLRPTAGRVHFQGHDVTRVPNFRRVRRGLVRTFQESSTFPDLTVRENLVIASQSTRRPRPAADVLELCSLAGDVDFVAGDLPYGKTKLLGIAMSMMTSPELLLLDEPAAGISAEETEALSAAILAVREAGMTVALIDHNVGFILPLSDRVYALDAGRVVTSGTADEVQANLDVISSYLGAPR
jgi:branched-chain amino acid transport system ATP-binding protein